MNRKLLVILSFGLMCNCATLGQQTGIGDIAQEGCRVAQRGKLNKVSVAAFINKSTGSEDSSWTLKPNEIQEFKWVDLAGDGRCELVMMLSYGPNASTLEIDWKDHYQALKGEANLKEATRDLYGDGKKEIIKSAIRDLNGAGKKEIALYSYLDPAGGRAAGGVTPVWPQVYRLEGEKYVPASAEFPDFYQREVLPELDKEIAGTPSIQEPVLAALEMQRDKIQRVLGRDPNAGLEKARQWAKSDNPELIEDAKDVFLDIGGHEEEVRAAEQAGKVAYRRWIASHSSN